MLAKQLLRKQRELFLNGLDKDTSVIYELNKKYLWTQIQPFNEKLLETRIQNVEMYGWIIRLRDIIKKMHAAVFMGKGLAEDELQMKGPYERVNEPIDMEIVYELNVIGKKTYDKLDVYKDYKPDPIKP